MATPSNDGAPSELVLPVERNRNFIELLMRDPDWGYAFWELTATAVDDALRELGVFSADADLHLRVYNVPSLSESTQNTPHVDTFAVDEWLGSRYVLLGRPETYHSVAIGLQTHQGLFHAMARSAWVRAPRSRPADDVATATIDIRRPEDTPGAD